MSQTIKHTALVNNAEPTKNTGWQTPKGAQTGCSSPILMHLGIQWIS